MELPTSVWRLWVTASTFCSSQRSVCPQDQGPFSPVSTALETHELTINSDQIGIHFNI